MRLILSRKGFDSAAGGCPSPISPDGSMLSLPIPDKGSPIRYNELSWRDWNVGELVERLTGGRQRADFRAHLDPDLRAEALPRTAGWRPTLGQMGAAQAHLQNQGILAGDLFLFFGLFRPVDSDLRPTGPPAHVIWGWMQIGEVVSIDDQVRPRPEQWSWLGRHPHLACGKDPRNMLYVAGHSCGVFECYSSDRRLTASDASGPSCWELPLGFLPRTREPLTFHRDAKRWSPQGERVGLRAASRGQEFVLELDQYPEVREWLSHLGVEPSP
jgi:hypothetical protein